MIVRITLCNNQGEKFFGAGPRELLERIRNSGSIHSSAAEMGMSYSKAMRMIRKMEQNLGQPVLNSVAGGPGGGGSTLTLLAEEFCRKYDELEKKCQEKADLVYGK